MSLHYLGKHEPRKLRLFTSTLYTALAENTQNSTKHINTIMWLQLNLISLTEQSTAYTKQNPGIEHGAVCYHTLTVCQVCHNIGR